MEPTEEPTTVALKLKILSPSAELAELRNSGLQFDNLPVSTTIGELKERIRDAVPTRPTNERQRLIYLGRVLARETDTLRDIFGATVVCIACAPKRGATVGMIAKQYMTDTRAAASHTPPRPP
jgi:hypothetical protein